MCVWNMKSFIANGVEMKSVFMLFKVQGRENFEVELKKFAPGKKWELLTFHRKKTPFIVYFCACFLSVF